MSKPLYDQAQWITLCESVGYPPVYVNVWNFRASIIVKGKDVTADIPNGEDLAAEATEAFGGAINISGIYPPTDDIMEALKNNGIETLY